MACPCCTSYYCHHEPCSKYGRLEVEWGGITTESAIAGRANSFGYGIDREDLSCTFPQGSVNGFIHTGMFGARYSLLIGWPQSGLNDSRPRNAPWCAESPSAADDFVISGDIGTQVAFSLLPNFFGYFSHFFTRWQYAITKDGQTITKVSETFQDFRQPEFGNGPVPDTCDDFIDAATALKDVEPSLRLIETTRGTRCLATELSGRGFPAVSGPHPNAAACAAVCENPLP
jgi:hypothetical protein